MQRGSTINTTEAINTVDPGGRGGSTVNVERINSECREVQQCIYPKEEGLRWMHCPWNPKHLHCESTTHDSGRRNKLSSTSCQFLVLHLNILHNGILEIISVYSAM